MSQVCLNFFVIFFNSTRLRNSTWSICSPSVPGSIPSHCTAVMAERELELNNDAFVKHLWKRMGKTLTEIVQFYNREKTVAIRICCS